MQNLNFKAIGHDFGVSLNKSKGLAIQALDSGQITKDNIPEHIEQDIRAGMLLAHIEIKGDSVSGLYGLIDGNYIKLSDEQAKKHKGEKIKMSVGFAMSESQQKFGQLKNTNPPLYALIKPVRDAANKYVSNTYKKFVSAVAEVSNERDGVTKTRSATKTFDETIAEFFMTMRKKVVNAKARGDDTANEERFRKAMVAFNTVWNHGE